MNIPRSLLTVAVALAALSSPSHAQTPLNPGETRVAQWKGDKKAAFLLMFDDGWPSQFQVALPELAKRGMIATFYICPDKGEYRQFESTWEEDFVSQGMVLANHTMTHDGVQGLDDAEYELGECAAYIRMVVPSLQDKLISYGQPGVSKDAWQITDEELKVLLEKHKLISRPDFKDHGAVYHLKTTEEMLALADKAIANGGMEYLIIHGVERTESWGYEDFWALDQDVFLPLLDGLKERVDRGELWVTDHISQHQYETERETAKVSTRPLGSNGIEVKVQCEAEPALYDYPLTVMLGVPATWTSVDAKQGEKVATGIPSKSGMVLVDAIPNGVPVVITQGK